MSSCRVQPRDPHLRVRATDKGLRKAGRLGNALVRGGVAASTPQDIAITERRLPCSVG